MRIRYLFTIFNIILLLCHTNAVQSDPPQTVVSRDGAEMVLIPASEFLIGTKDSELEAIVVELRQYSPGRPLQRNWFEDETPQHRVFLDAYYIDKYEVTNAQYQKFMEATGYPAPEYWQDSQFNHPSQPVVGVSWDDAMAYAQWAGKTLPTEAQWEAAARGGLSGKRYPWGDRFPPPPNSGNFLEQSIADYTDGYSHTAPVGSFKPNGYGIHDMVGNTAEWCLDAYSETFYQHAANAPDSPVINTPQMLPTAPLRSNCQVERQNRDLPVPMERT